jgi:long-subunit fatty acid transport protein
MKYLAALTGLALTTGMVQAGGIDRSTLPFSVLFEDGRIIQLGFSNVTPKVSGVAGGVVSTGDMAQSFTSLSFAYKADLTDTLSYAIILNQPYGADALYGSVYAGLEAHWDTEQLTALIKYQATDRFSVYGGLKYVRSSADILIPPVLLGPAGTYTASADTDGQVGYVLGMAYEIPDIALRVGLSYESEITHSFGTTERFSALNAGATLNSTTDIVLPQTVTLDFQTGVADGTLVFGSVRWSEWSKYHVRPSYFEAVTGGEVTGYDDDVVTYELGVGRKINDSLSLFARIGYERTVGDVASRLSPTDGSRSFGIGGSFTKDNMKITGGVEYVELGDAVDASGVRFTDNKAVGVDISVQFRF